jgi:hypothetical protein
MKRLLLSLSIIVLASTEVNAQCASYTQSYGYQSYQQSYSYNQKGLFKGCALFKKKAYMQEACEEACGYVSVNFIPIYSTPMYPTPTPQNNYPPPPNKTTPTPQNNYPPPPTPQPGVQR